MSTERVVTVNAADGKMTLGELRSFIGEMDQAGAAEETVIGARVTFSGHLKQVKATAVRFGDPGDRHDR